MGFWRRWMGREAEQVVTFRVPDGSNLDRLIAGLTGAVNAHAIAISKLAENPEFPPDLAFVPQRLEIVHGLVFELNRKVDTFMATQEERLRGVKTKLDAIQAGVDRIQEQLATLKTNNPELEDEIAAIEATAAAIDTDVNPTVGGTEG